MRRRARLSLVVTALALLLGAGGVAARDAPRPDASRPDAVRQNGDPGAVRIDAPTGGARVGGRVEIRGRATWPDPSRFSFYRLHHGPGPSPTMLRPIGPPGDRSVEDGLLGVWDTAGVAPGEHVVVLTVYDVGGNTIAARTAVVVEPTPTPTPLVNPPPAVYATPAETGEEPSSAPAPPLPDFAPIGPPVRPSDPLSPAPPPVVIPDIPPYEPPPLPPDLGLPTPIGLPP